MIQREKDRGEERGEEAERKRQRGRDRGGKKEIWEERHIGDGWKETEGNRKIGRDREESHR